MNMKGLYELMSWMSPSYPVGAYTYSHGVEYAVEEGLIRTVDDLTAWISDIVSYGSGKMDTILLAEVYNAVTQMDDSRLIYAAEIGHACRATKELDLETCAQGRAFMTITEDVFPSRSLHILRDKWAGPIVYPVAVAAAAADRDMGLETTLTAYLHGFVSNLVSAAVRIVPLGQTDGQRAIAALEAVTSVQVQAALNSTLEDLGTTTLMVDWCSCQHETQYTRLFRS